MQDCDLGVEIDGVPICRLVCVCFSTVWVVHVIVHAV